MFEPPIFSVNIMHVLGAFSWMYILLNASKIEKYLNVKKLVIIYLIISFIFAHLIIVIVFNNSNLNYAASPIYWLIDIIPFSIFITLYLRINKMTNSFINIIISAGMIQAVLVVLSFLFNDIQVFFISRMIDYGYGTEIESLSFRMYGFASNLTFSSSILLSVIGLITMWFALNKDNKYYICTLLLFYASIVNSRTSIVIIVAGIILLFIHKISIKKIIKIIVFTLVSVLLFVIISDLIRSISYETYRWLEIGIEDLLDLLFNNSNIDNNEFSYFNYLFSNDRWYVPSDVSILYGSGIRPFYDSILDFKTDIGYINDLWLGGIVYIISLYGFFFHMILYPRLKWKYNKEYSYIAYLLMIVMIVSNLKGYIFIMNNVTNLIIIIYVFSLQKYRKELI